MARHAVSGTSTALAGATSTARWAYPRLRTGASASRAWASDRIEDYGEALRDLEERDWQLTRSVPGLGVSILPVLVLLIAVALAVGLGGMIAAALS